MIENDSSLMFADRYSEDSESKRILRWAEEMAGKEPGYVKRILGEIEAEKRGRRASARRSRT